VFSRKKHTAVVVNEIAPPSLFGTYFFIVDAAEKGLHLEK
jgi:hypothetical protein